MPASGFAGSQDGYPTRQPLVVEDVLGTHFFPEHATGALVVIGRHPAEPVELVAASRTWTPSPNGIGTLGQGIGGIPWRGSDLLDEEKVLVGLESSDDVRTNLGLVNLSLNQRSTFAVAVFDAFGALAGTLSTTLEPWSHFQLDELLGELGLAGAGYTARVSIAATSIPSTTSTRRSIRSRWRSRPMRPGSRRG